jgi:hypothetical protein
MLTFAAVGSYVALADAAREFAGIERCSFYQGQAT